MVEMDVTFFQDKSSKDVDEKSLTLTLKVGRGKSSKPVSIGSKVLDLADFHRDGTKVERIFALTQGSNPVTLKASVETRWTHIDNKLIVRGKSGRPIRTADGGEESYDLETVTFDSEDENTVGGGGAGDVAMDFSEDEESGASSSTLQQLADQNKEMIALTRELEELKATNEQLRTDLKNSEAKVETYRNTIKTKNDQITDLKASRDEKIALLAGADAKISAGEEKAIALQSKLDAVSRVLKDREDKNEADRQRFEKELRELRLRNEELHARVTADTASNAQFLSAVEKQAAEAAAALKAEKSARRKIEKELAHANRREQTLVAELEEAVPEAANVEEAAPAPSSQPPTPMKDIGGAVVEAIRNRRRAEMMSRERSSSSSSSSLLPQKDTATTTAVAELEEKNRSLAAELASVKAELEVQKAEGSKLKDSVNSQNALQQSEIARVENEKEASKRKLVEAETRLKVVEREMIASKDEQEALRKRNEALAETVREALEARASAQSALLEMRETQTKLTAEISAKQRDLARSATAQSSKLEELRQQAAEQLQAMEMSHVQVVEQLRERVKSLEQSLAEKESPAIVSPGREFDLKPGTIVDAAVAFGKGAAGGEAAALREAFRREKMDLERRADQAREDSRRAEEELHRLERKVVAMEKTLNEARRVADESKSRLSEALAELNELKEANREREEVLQSAEREFLDLSRKASELEGKLKERELAVQQLELRVSTFSKAAETSAQELQSAEKRATQAEQAVDEIRAAHKTEMKEVHERLTEVRQELRNVGDKAKAAEAERDALVRKVASLQAEVDSRGEVERDLSGQLAMAETKLRASTRGLYAAEEGMQRERKRATELEAELLSVRNVEATVRRELQQAKEEQVKVREQLKKELQVANDRIEKVSRENASIIASASSSEAANVTRFKDAVAAVEEQLAAAKAEVAAQTQRAAELELHLEGKTTSLEEISQRLVQAEARVKETEQREQDSLQLERQKAERLHEQITSLTASEASLKREVQTLKEDARAASEHAAVIEDLLEKKNKNLSSLEEEIKSSEAELAQYETQLGLLKKQLAERKEEAALQKDRADSAVVLAAQVQSKYEQATAEANAKREADAANFRNMELAASEAKRALKDAERSIRSLEAERDSLRARLTETEAAVRSEKTRAEAAESSASRVAELEEELAQAQETVRSSEIKIRQLREASGELGEKVEQLSALDKEKRERKLVISAVLLGTSDENAKDQVAKSSKAICDSFTEWGTLSGDGDSSCLTKLANGYSLLLQTSTQSYYHCIRVLSQLCSLAKSLRQVHELNINDPSRTGVVSTKDRSAGHGSVDEFLSKLELITEKAFIAVGESIFRRINPYLAPAILNHMPAQDEHRIEETVVDSGNERGKFMSHTVLSTLTDARDWMTRYALPEAVAKQIFVTLMYNLNAYLFQYLIQTPSICTPTNAFTIKTRLGLLSDWFNQERNNPFADAYTQLKPMDEAAVLLFVDRESFTDWETIRRLCPSLNELQVMSLVEMLATDDTQKQELPKHVRDDIDKKVLVQDNLTLFFKPKQLIPL